MSKLNKNWLWDELIAKKVMEKIGEYLAIRFWDNDPNIRECWLLDFQIWIGRKISFTPLQVDDKRVIWNDKFKKQYKLKKYLSLSK